jgi:hypothetical protein
MPDQQVLAGLAVAASGLLDELCGIRRFGEHGNFDLHDLMYETGGRGFRSAETFFGPRTGEAVMSHQLAGESPQNSLKQSLLSSVQRTARWMFIRPRLL